MSSGVQYVSGSFPGSEEGMKESRHSSGEGSGGWLLTEVVVTVAPAAGLGWWELFHGQVLAALMPQVSASTGGDSLSMQAREGKAL